MKSWQIDFKASNTEHLSWELLSAGANAVNEISDTLISAFISGEEADLELFLKNLQSDVSCDFELLKTSQLEDKNWIQNCPELLEVIKIGNITIYPVKNEKEAYQTNQRNDFFIIPDQAFGTGHHPTTRMCLELLQNQEIVNEGPSRILDFGCGSGILSIVASTLYQADCVALDIDSNALLNTKQNIAINYFAKSIKVIDDFKIARDEKFDLILANIYSSLLLEYAEQFHQILNHNGALIFSGILEEQYQDLLKCYCQKWKEVTKVTSNEWVAALFLKI